MAQQNYSLTDFNASNDLLTYRLRQLDLDGSEHILGSVSVGPDASAVRESISIYPNPAKASAAVSFTLPSPEDVRISIVNDLGAELHLLASARYPSGTNSLSFETKDLPSGSYHLVLSAGGKQVVKEFVVVK
ncbi:MAG: T9SS type A sorting domain-containing protein [Bacteroidota bacterium]|nr:T9SS type A sorting domain-containing protein [Bacteroidota bacterium]